MGFDLVESMKARLGALKPWDYSLFTLVLYAIALGDTQGGSRETLASAL